MPTIEETLNSAIEHHAAGRLPEAEALYRHILQEEPNHADTLHLMGILAHQTGQTQIAVDYINKAITHNPSEATYFHHLGLALQSQGKLDEAITNYQQALRLRPNYARPIFLLADALKAQRKHQEAIEFYRMALQIEPSHAEGLFNLGVCQQATGQHEDAIESYTRVISLKPDKAEAFNNLGSIYMDLDQTIDAVYYFEQALRIKPTLGEAHYNKGNLYTRLGHYDKAVNYYEEAIRLRPGLMPAYHHLVRILIKKLRYAEAMDLCQKALAVSPEEAGMYNSMGLIYNIQWRVEEAVACFNKAIEIHPGLWEPYANLAAAQLNMGHGDQAKVSYERALALNPSDALRLKMGIVLPPVYQSTADLMAWRERYVNNVRQLMQQPLEIADPLGQVGQATLYLAYQGFNDREIRQDVAQMLSGIGNWIRVKPPVNKKPRIGFISRYLHSDHTVGKMFQGIIENLSRETFDVMVFTIGGSPTESPVTAPHTHINLPVQDLKLIAETIARKKPDVLIYTDIGMDPLSYYLGFHRLAPVQCVTWGHPVTTGIPTMDYFISSRLFEPEDNAQEHYSEQLVQLDTLPAFYQRPTLDESQEVSRAAFGFTSDEHIYLCPQTLLKFHPEFDSTLASILNQDPQGVLVLVNAYTPQWGDRLMERFEKTLPDARHRVRILDRQSFPSFLSLLSAADVILDTPGFGGARSVYESLALGMPVVTQPSQMLRGRIALGCYRKMGMMDCVAESPEEYADIAVRLATQPAFHDSVKSRILASCHVLFEDREAVSQLETFLHGVLQTGAVPS